VYIVDENGMDSSNTGGPSNSGELAWKEAIKKILAFDGHCIKVLPSGGNTFELFGVRCITPPPDCTRINLNVLGKDVPAAEMYFK
jgi:hypothetical protein